MSGIRGDLNELGFIELVQTLSLGQKSCVVLLDGVGRGRAHLWVHNGRVVDAEAGRVVGNEAFYELATWTHGAFEIRADESVRTTGRISASNDVLILEAIRRIEESDD